jgi:cytochrome c oxidase subunit 4
MDTSPHIREAAHPTPRTYVTIAALLAAITAFEVGIFYIEAIKDLLIPIFIVLSAVKFIMVAMYYMHLKFDERLFSVFFVGGLALATAVILALMALFGVLLDTPSVEAIADTSYTHQVGTLGDQLKFSTTTQLGAYHNRY